MTILDIATAKPLKSNIHMHIVTVDGLSHKVICTCLWTQEAEQICCQGFAGIYCTTSTWLNKISSNDPMWNTLPYHVSSLQKMYGPFQCYQLQVIE